MRTIIVHKTNSFRLGTTKKYAVLAFKEDGLKILCTNENPENFDTLVLALASRVGIIYLPTIVMQAYGLEREDYEVEIINENKFFIRRKRNQRICNSYSFPGSVPTPLGNFQRFGRSRSPYYKRWSDRITGR